MTKKIRESSTADVLFFKELKSKSGQVNIELKKKSLRRD